MEEDWLKEAKREMARTDKGNETAPLRAIAAALIALVERLDRVTGDTAALRVTAYNYDAYREGE